MLGIYWLVKCSAIVSALAIVVPDPRVHINFQVIDISFIHVCK